MAAPLVECIPNFSDARRPEVIDAIINEIQSVPNVHILDKHSDMDHNRTVVTYVGTPDAVEEAAFLAIKKAAELIDLNEHQGEHPRMGATDVVPFVPISEVSMKECIEMAQRLGKRVGEELSIPVFLYEEAAAIPEKKNLENIRKGQYEVIKNEIGLSLVRTPDFGPIHLGSAGATVIGARQPLIAYNVYLTTNDVDIAQKIAKVVRNSSGGLRFVKAMGVLVDGRAQVSMNLTNFSKTPIAQVFEMIRREAQRYGVSIQSSELVGLIPQAAITDAAQWYTQLDGFDQSQVLEQRLFEIMLNTQESNHSHEDFLSQLASDAPTPGGGSASAYTAAAGAALVTMVARTTIGKKKYADVQEKMEDIIIQSELLRNKLMDAVILDSAAFDAVMQAYKLPKNSAEEIQTRLEAIQSATLEAAKIPLESARLSVSVMEMALEAATYGNLNAISDAGAGCFMAKAGVQAAALNVKINVPGLDDENKRRELLTSVKDLENQANHLEQQLKVLLNNRGKLSFD